MSAASRERERQRAAKIENAHGCRESLCNWYDKSPEERKKIVEAKKHDYSYSSHQPNILDIMPEMEVPLTIAMAAQARGLMARMNK